VHESYDMLPGSLSSKQQALPTRRPNLRATAALRDNCYKAIDEGARLAPSWATWSSYNERVEESNTLAFEDG
jgi:hypothetical protein